MGGTECDDDTGTSGTCAMWAGEEGGILGFGGGGVILIFHPFSVKKEKSQESVTVAVRQHCSPHPRSCVQQHCEAAAAKDRGLLGEHLVSTLESAYARGV